MNSASYPASNPSAILCITEPADGAPLKWADDGANGSTKSLHVAGSTAKGSDQAYGVEVGTNLISTKGSLYDGSKYVGVSFQAKRGPKSVKKVIDINLLGAVNSIHAVVPEMIDRGSGQIVAISSLAGFRGLPKSAAYSASKAGMTAFFESVRLDVANKGVSVTIIQPGFIRTPLTSGRANKMPFLMELDDAIPHFISAIEKQKRFAAFPWQLATFVRAGKYMPGWLYDRIAGRARYRE